jgi:hypothetical protein
LIYLWHIIDNQLIVTTKGEWVGLFRNERDANPYVVAQATSLFTPKISPNPVVFTIPHRVQVFYLGVQYHSLQPWVDWEGEHPQFVGYICKVCVCETSKGKSNSLIWSYYGKVGEFTFDPLAWTWEDGTKLLRYTTSLRRKLKRNNQGLSRSAKDKWRDLLQVQSKLAWPKV